MYILVPGVYFIGIFNKWVILLAQILIAYKQYSKVIQSNNNKTYNAISPWKFYFKS